MLNLSSDFQAVSNGHRFRILGLKKGFEYQFRVWYVWDEEVLCGMPFVSKWIEPEGALLASGKNFLLILLNLFHSTHQDHGAAQLNSQRKV